MTLLFRWTTYIYHINTGLWKLKTSVIPLKQMCFVCFRYIEGLQADSKHISHWDKHLKATPDNTAIPDPSRLPAHWLGNGVGNHGNIVNALWTLRDFMMRDALGINKVI